ncbi:MAG: TRAP transporter large permease subunit [Deltaproteobacteria bacterium]|nr:MAG: TRAP transporter large permease subunit [Deltaproteobacteria bacterium]
MYDGVVAGTADLGIWLPAYTRGRFPVLSGLEIVGIYFGSCGATTAVAITRVPFALSEWVAGLELPPLVVMGMIIMVYLIGGCFMDALGLILLTVPIIFPVAVSLGFDPIWFGIIITRVSEIGVITPPVGINVYVMKGVATDVPLSTIFRGILPFLAADVVSVGLLLFIPQIALFLPSIIRY